MKDRRVSSLQFAVRPRVVAKLLGQLLLVFAALSLVPFLFSIFVQEYLATRVYAAVLSVTVMLGFLLQRIKAPPDVQHNETLVISALIFIITPLVATIPFHFLGLNWSDAFFEAVSGVTTTGLSTLPGIEDKTGTFLLSRAWLQWTGGLGIVVLSIAILLPQSKVTLNLFEDNWERQGVVASTKAYARTILGVYLLLTVTGILLLLGFGVGWFDGAIHIFAAVSTGGFSSFDSSLAGLESRTAQGIVTLFSFLGAVPFILFYLIPRGEWRKLVGNEEVQALAGVVLLAAAVMTACFVLVDGRKPLDAIQLAVSAQTTTGFATVPVGELSELSKFVLLPMMLFGGTVGSTAGGIKILRLLIMLKMIKLLVVRSGMVPDAVVHPRLKERRLEDPEIERCFMLIMLFLIVAGLSWGCFIVMGYPPLDSLFEVVSATCTVGLSAGLSSQDLPLLLKGILCLDMLLGRLEIIAFLVLFYPPTWHGKQRGVKA